jgi:hypothetical protein
VNVIRSRDVCSSDVRFTAELGIRWHTIGIKVYPWGVRFMLVWWHYFSIGLSAEKTADGVTFTIESVERAKH